MSPSSQKVMKDESKLFPRLKDLSFHYANFVKDQCHKISRNHYRLLHGTPVWNTDPWCESALEAENQYE